jgi:hypothetical protein
MGAVARSVSCVGGAALATWLRPRLRGVGEEFSLVPLTALSDDNVMHPEQVRIFRAMAPARKLELAAEFYFAARHLKSQAVKLQHPDWTDEQVQRKVREMFLYAAS